MALNIDMKTFAEGFLAQSAVFEAFAAAIIATHPDRDQLLAHLRWYRSHALSSTDGAKNQAGEILDRIDKEARSLAVKGLQPH